jgi:hypothetical protein
MFLTSESSPASFNGQPSGPAGTRMRPQPGAKSALLPVGLCSMLGRVPVSPLALQKMARDHPARWRTVTVTAPPITGTRRAWVCRPGRRPRPTCLSTGAPRPRLSAHAQIGARPGARAESAEAMPYAHSADRPRRRRGPSPDSELEVRAGGPPAGRPGPRARGGRPGVHTGGASWQCPGDACLPVGLFPRGAAQSPSHLH